MTTNNQSYDPMTVPGRGDYSEAARQARLDYLGDSFEVDTGVVGPTTIDPGSLYKNTENFFASVEVPVGLAGPLVIHQDGETKVRCAPLATTEGALIASCCRGAKALNRSGGVHVHFVQQQVQRDPNFICATVGDAVKLSRWLEAQAPSLRGIAESVSRHAKIQNMKTTVVGRNVHFLIDYHTDQASGQNMVTACSWHMIKWIREELKNTDINVVDSTILGFMSMDKHVSHMMLSHGRGSWVIAEAILTEQAAREVLKISLEDYARVTREMRNTQSIAGGIGFDINISNALAAMFIATGQDVACVHESSIGMLDLDFQSDHVKLALTLPSVMVATIGGGTHLSKQNAFNKMLGDNSATVACSMAAFSLALDISTAAAIASDDFAIAHERLGRNRPVQWLTKKDLDRPLFEEALANWNKQSITELEPLEVSMGSSILTDLSVRKSHRVAGLFPYRFVTEDEAGNTATSEVVVKIKPCGEEIVLMLGGVASTCGSRVAELFRELGEELEFFQCNIREVKVYQLLAEHFPQLAPKLEGFILDDEREAYVLVMERLSAVELKDSENEPESWTKDHVSTALDSLCQFHAHWLGEKVDELEQLEWMSPRRTADWMKKSAPLWSEIALETHRQFPEVLTKDDLEFQQGLIATSPTWWVQFEELPHTLVHNDANPRNLAFQNNGGQLALKLYDWELASVLPPQRDIVELLCFLISPDWTDADIGEWFELARTCLEKHAQTSIAPDEWTRGCLLAAADFRIYRLSMYMMSYEAKQHRYMSTLLRNSRRLVELDLALVGLSDDAALRSASS